MQLLVDFAISDQIFAKAKVPVTDSVNLWLGANVMLEYPLEEAGDLLVSDGRQAGSCSFLTLHEGQLSVSYGQTVLCAGHIHCHACNSFFGVRTLLLTEFVCRHKISRTAKQI